MQSTTISYLPRPLSLVQSLKFLVWKKGERIQLIFTDQSITNWSYIMIMLRFKKNIYRFLEKEFWNISPTSGELGHKNAKNEVLSFFKESTLHWNALSNKMYNKVIIVVDFHDGAGTIYRFLHGNKYVQGMFWIR